MPFGIKKKRGSNLPEARQVLARSRLDEEDESDDESAGESDHEEARKVVEASLHKIITHLSAKIDMCKMVMEFQGIDVTKISTTDIGNPTTFDEALRMVAMRKAERNTAMLEMERDAQRKMEESSLSAFDSSTSDISLLMM